MLSQFLYRLSDHLGGVLLCEEAVPFKKHLAEYLERQAGRLEAAGVELHLGQTLSPEEAEKLGADVLIAAIGSVRRDMVRQQQAMGRDKGIVMDGRDIGTVVFPDAELKVFVTADPMVRAQRRYDELRAKGDTTTTLDEVLHNVNERDHIDTTRAESPLRKADDAIVLDNSHMTIAEQNAFLLGAFQASIVHHE